MSPTEKTALTLGIYGTVLSTITCAIQIFNYFKERTNILMHVQTNMVTTDRMNETYTIITAVNRGKRPVRTLPGTTIQQNAYSWITRI